ncbi:MAG: FHA domain-containing protein [SAR324 cluster bacterium]|nr:FHA domain-containing protein [SAR324 cluster bacterium]
MNGNCTASLLGMIPRRALVSAGLLGALFAAGAGPAWAGAVADGPVAREQGVSVEASPAPAQVFGGVLGETAPVARHAAVFRLGLPTNGGAEALWHGAAFVATLPVLVWLLLRQRGINKIVSPGFEIITNSEPREFIPLKEKFQHMDFLNQVETKGALRLSANLNKVNLSFRRYGYLLEDKNFRNALLVNRRRVRRTLLRDGDVLDLGDLTLLYRDNREVPITRHSAITPPEGKVQIKFDKARGPVRKGTPMLVCDLPSARNYYITKNLIFIGRSENNDLIVKSRNVAYRHAKIERIGGRYKLLDLANTGNTFVNNRRVEQRMLKDGDEISIDNQRMKFQLVQKPVNELPRVAQSPPEPANGELEELNQHENLPRTAEE